jgi:outer membrane protein OmpA-like peptidoglycan-associated protein
MDEIILNFDADYKFNEPNKSYLTEKLNMAKKMGHSNNVVIYGYVNDAKNEESNIQKSLKMANDVAEYLKVSGYIPVSVQGKGSEDLENSEYVRKVQIQLFQYR